MIDTKKLGYRTLSIAAKAAEKERSVSGNIVRIGVKDVLACSESVNTYKNLNNF